MTDRNHYETLGIERTATGDDIRKAYRSEAQKHHPDRGGDAERMQALNLARDTLLDADARAAYDADLDLGPDVIQLHRLARECLIVHFKQVLAAIDSPAGILARVSADLAQAHKVTQVRYHQAQSRREALLKRRRRVRTKGGAENIFHVLIDHEIAGLDDQIASLARVLEVYPVCDQLLRAYEEEFEQPAGTGGGAFDAGLRQLLRGLHGDGLMTGGGV
jgi:curved DNA-binding protein CbpA